MKKSYLTGCALCIFAVSTAWMSGDAFETQLPDVYGGTCYTTGRTDVDYCSTTCGTTSGSNLESVAEAGSQRADATACAAVANCTAQQGLDDSKGTCSY